MKQTPRIQQLDDFEVYRPENWPAQRVAIQSAEEPEEHLTRGQLTTSWICRLIAAGIMLETLFFKFTGAPESVYIFSRMNMEAWWRYGQGVWELIAAILLLWPRYVWAGALLTLGAIGAAILSHLTVLGIVVQNDGGLLFGMAWTTFICALIVTWIHQHSIPNVTPMAE